jgi:hypothetical protein
MRWIIEFERPLDGALLVDRSAANKGAAAIADAYLNQFRSVTDVRPNTIREEPSESSVDKSIRPGEIRDGSRAAAAGGQMPGVQRAQQG